MMQFWTNFQIHAALVECAVSAKNAKNLGKPSRCHEYTDASILRIQLPVFFQLYILEILCL